jgi:uncharacterized protein
MIFVDTGAFLARHLPRDQHHELARDAWRQLEELREGLVTSNLVINELVTLLTRWSSAEDAATRGRSLYASRVLEIWRPDEDVELTALGLVSKFGDQRISFTDAVSFALMRRRGVRRAFTFDHHFRLAGFEVWPETSS